jgi:hypothetical protein
MKKLILSSIICLSFAPILLSSCKKDDNNSSNNNNNNNNQAGKVNVTFENKVGNEELVFNTKTYKNQNGEDFTISMFNYYISNIRLESVDGKTYAEPESYHLVMEDKPASKSFTLSDVPAGKYKSVTFLIGVDSLRNVSGAQTGALDPAHGMFWTWNTGYIMLKFEGASPQSTATDNKLAYHLGGFSGANSVLRTVTLTFASPIDINGAATGNLQLQADLLQLFRSPNMVEFSQYRSSHLSGEASRKIADNYQTMFRLK